MLGLNQYFGWYPWVEDFTVLEPYLYELRDHYPSQAIVMTEWGAEARPELSTAALDRKGGYPFQDMHAARTLDVIDRSPVLSGAIYWTLREFEIYPGWMGGAGRRPAEYEPNTRHHKGLLTYEGEPQARLLDGPRPLPERDAARIPMAASGPSLDARTTTSGRPARC